MAVERKWLPSWGLVHAVGTLHLSRLDGQQAGPDRAPFWGAW